MVKEKFLHIQVQLDNVTWMHYNPLHFLEDSNNTSPLQKGGIKSQWFADQGTICMNASINLLFVDVVTQYTEGNSCGFIDIPVIEITFYNDYIHILNDLPKRHMYRYLV